MVAYTETGAILSHPTVSFIKLSYCSLSCIKAKTEAKDNPSVLSESNAVSPAPLQTMRMTLVWQRPGSRAGLLQAGGVGCNVVTNGMYSHITCLAALGPACVVSEVLA